MVHRTLHNHRSTAEPLTQRLATPHLPTASNRRTMDEATVVAAVAAGHEEYSVLVDLAAGTVAGCSGIIVGQPLDTVRTIAQKEREP